MPTIAPWLHPLDFVGAASRGAQLGLEARGQDIAQSEFNARMAAEQERTAAGDALRAMQMQMLHEYRGSEAKHQRAMEELTGRRLDLSEAGQQQKQTASEALLQARYDLADKAQSAHDERLQKALDSRDERQRKSLEYQRIHSQLMGAYQLRQQSHLKLLGAKRDRDKEGTKIFQQEYDNADSQVIALEQQMQGMGQPEGEGGGAASDLSARPATLPQALQGPGGSFQFGAIDENTQFPPPQNESPSAPAIGKKLKILSIEPVPE